MSVRKLAGETLIYGGSHILGKLINFGLLWVYTDIFIPSKFGVQSFIYAIIPFLAIALSYRIEVAYFRYGSEGKTQEATAFSTSAISVITSTVGFTLLLLLLLPWLIGFTNYEEYLSAFYLAIGIVCFDVFNSILYAKLRLDGRPIRFALAQLGGVVLTVLLNIFFFYYCPRLTDNALVQRIYDPAFGIGYIFLANFLGSLFSFVLLSPQLRHVRFHQFDWTVWKQMITFASPLILVGFSFVINETFDRLVIPAIAPGTPEQRDAANGIYAAVYKLTMFIALFRQAFQYAGEPFFFQQKNADNAKQIYADVAKYFTIVVATGFLFVMLYLDILKFMLRDPAYFEGLFIMPILLMANLLLGIYYNFSVWYKVTDRTRWGAYISIGGAIITIVLNLIFIPQFGYLAAAWVTLIAYSSMTVASYLLGQRFYPIPYQIGRMLLYIGLAFGGYLLSEVLHRSIDSSQVLTLAINTLILLLYLSLALGLEWQGIQRYFLRRN